MTHVYAFAGKKGSGKTFQSMKFAASVSRDTIDHFSFADKLRAECMKFTLTNVFVGQKDRDVNPENFTEEGQRLLSENSGIKTNRDFMMFISDCLKQENPTIFADHLVSRLKSKMTIVDDLRFPNEFDALVASGKHVVVLFVGSFVSDVGCHPSENVGLLVRHVRKAGGTIIFMRGKLD